MAELPQEFFKRIEDACRLAEEKAYQQGRADKYQEITSEYMLLTEKQVEEIRADVIENIEKELMHWEDWMLAESPTGYRDAIEFSADDMQSMVVRTIRECSNAIYKVLEELKQPTHERDAKEEADIWFGKKGE